jgi:hypothetical protein
MHSLVNPANFFSPTVIHPVRPFLPFPPTLLIALSGCGYHGDFMMGWDPVFLQDAVDQCTNLSGQIADCPLFNIQAEDSHCSINLPSALVSENVIGPMASLPGNVPVVSGPGPASGATAGSPVTGAPPAPSSVDGAIPTPTLGYSAGQSLASTDTYIPGGIFAVSIPSTADAAPTSTTVAAPAVTKAPVPASSNTESFFSTQYVTSGRAVLEVLWVEEVITVTDPFTTTVLVPGRKRHINRHLHQNVH